MFSQEDRLLSTRLVIQQHLVLILTPLNPTFLPDTWTASSVLEMNTSLGAAIVRTGVAPLEESHQLVRVARLLALAVAKQSES